jgi:hypothetical protein
MAMAKNRQRQKKGNGKKEATAKKRNSKKIGTAKNIEQPNEKIYIERPIKVAVLLPLEAALGL